jgi:hypothetical protein
MKNLGEKKRKAKKNDPRTLKAKLRVTREAKKIEIILAIG